MPQVAYIPSISGTLSDTGVYRHTTEPIFIKDRMESLDLETRTTYKHAHTHIYMLASEWIVNKMEQLQKVICFKHLYT